MQLPSGRPSAVSVAVVMCRSIWVSKTMACSQRKFREDEMEESTSVRPAMFDRRTALAGVALAAVATRSATAAEGGPLSDLPITLPRVEFVYELIVDLDPTMDLGQSPLGQRRMVPITGGFFQGPRLRGKVLSGGADRQLVRADGVRLLNALYELQTDDGAIITVNNRVMVEQRQDGSNYAFSHLDITAPEGPHGWLNHLIFVGTLHSMRPQPKVLIRVYSLG
jgi:hypothetical protein